MAAEEDEAPSELAEPPLASVLAVSVPALTVVMPLYVLAALSASVLEPTFVRLAAPEMPLLTVVVVLKAGRTVMLRSSVTGEERVREWEMPTSGTLSAKA